MNIALPAPIERYLQADANADETLLSACFVADAEVRDEGRAIRGHDAILAWKRASKTKYQYQVHPQSVSQKDDTVVMVASVTGNFPGSPAALTYTFVLRADRIASLEIR